jgi:hypothetical protein
MTEIKHGGVYAYIHGWGQPELTKGFQCWRRACGIWGGPEKYEGRPDDENPFVACNFTKWVLEHPEKELPFVNIYSRGGSHFTEMGWPPFPRFFWAMMKTKQPFIFSNSRSPVEHAIRRGRIKIRLDRSLPAFGNCSLDDNVGEGDIKSGRGWNSSQINAYVLWDSENIVDARDRWEITVWVDDSSYYPDCTVDVTPRRCQKFSATPGQKLNWTNHLLRPEPEEEEKGKKEDKGKDKEQAATPAPKPKLIQSGTVTADDHGLVTIEKLRVTKGRHRVRITRPE